METSTQPAVAVQTKDNASTEPVRHSMFWHTFWLALYLVAVKACILRQAGGISFRNAVRHPEDLSIVPLYADYAFALTLGLFFQAGGILSTPWPRIKRGVRLMGVIACTASIMYAILSYQLFLYLRTPLTTGLIRTAGNFGNMRSSISEYVTTSFICTLVILPLSYLVLTRVTNRKFVSRQARWRRAATATCTLIVLGQYFYVNHELMLGHWSLYGSQALAKNAHLALLRSVAEEIIGKAPVKWNSDFPTEFSDEFSAAPAPIRQASVAVSPRPMNVILVVLESTGTPYLTTYGSRFDTSPNLAAEASHSIVFNNCYAHVGKTAGSLSAIILSRYPKLSLGKQRKFPDRVDSDTVAGILGQHDYRTVFITSSDIDFEGQKQNLQNRGFDEIIDYHQLPSRPIFSWGVEDRFAFEWLFNWIDAGKARPFYAVIWTTQAHHPYQPSPGQVVQYPGVSPELNRYLNALHEDDRQLGTLFQFLRAQDLAKNTIVIITGDHGEAFGAPHDCYGHGMKVYQDNLSVPLVLWSPSLFSSGRRDQTVGGHVDINPTILHLLGLAAPSEWQGRSLLAAQPLRHAYFFADKSDFIFGVREGNWKYIFNLSTGSEEMYDIINDPTEQNNVAVREADSSKILRQRIAAWVRHEAFLAN